MKKYLLIPLACVAMLTTLISCAQLSSEDRATLTATHDLAVQAKKEADEAAQQAKAAAAAAQSSSDKADRIYQQSQNK